jgi:hypothetical protein
MLGVLLFVAQQNSEWKVCCWMGLLARSVGMEDVVQVFRVIPPFLSLNLCQAALTSALLPSAIHQKVDTPHPLGEVLLG